MSRLEELIQQHCPDGVEYKQLDEVCYATSNIKWKNTSEYYEYIDLTSVDIDTHAIVATTKINSDTAPSRAQQIVKQGDVIFATTRPTQMRVCLIPPKYDGEICSTGYCVLRPDNTKVLSSFLFYILSKKTQSVKCRKALSQGFLQPEIHFLHKKRVFRLRACRFADDIRF